MGGDEGGGGVGEGEGVWVKKNQGHFNAMWRG